MTEQYVNALLKLEITDITILGRSKRRTDRISQKYKLDCIFGGYENNLTKIPKKDLTIITLPPDSLANATDLSLECGHTNILVEKPGALYAGHLLLLDKKITNQRVRIAYNRLFYQSFHELKKLVEKDGGITSCRFEFTEWVHTIDFKKYQKDVYQRWGIVNSLHVISMAFRLIGIPKKLSSYQFGRLPWHKSGSVFVGSGISNTNIPFSYHADWSSSGRWGLAVMTKKHSYHLIPLEKLFKYKIGTTESIPIQLKPTYIDVKDGLAEQIIAMMSKNNNPNLITLQEAAKLINITEDIFGYHHDE